MEDEIEDVRDDQPEQEYRPVTIEGLIRVISIVFVSGVYIVIFLKILFLS